MSRELEAAAEAVEEYLLGRELNANRVLAAHLRAVGLTPNGRAWRAAKAARNKGASFAEAARLAASETGSVQDATSRPNAATSSANATNGHQEEHKRHESETPSTQTQPAKAGATARASLSSDRRAIWYPKPFGPGDMAGEGAQRLLGKPDVSIEALLVRETAQNSWDARLPETKIEFELHLRRLTDSERSTLADELLVGDAPDLGLRNRLAAPDTKVLEVSDRGSVGLQGPVRNDLQIQPGQPTNFIDFVFNLGSHSDDELSGGTYGFGKTAAYVASRCGTVVIWSRCETRMGLQHRLIGSAIGPDFAMDGRNHTGRHWWGRAADPPMHVQPFQGSHARGVGQRIFDRHFVGAETGTSLLIIDPDLPGEGPTEQAQRLADAVTWHLWPKLVADTEDRDLMGITVRLDGEEIALPDPMNHPVLRPFVRTLQAVRDAQRGDARDNGLVRVHIEEIRCGRPKQLLGHLALTKDPVLRRAPDGRTANANGLTTPSHHVAWMRHEAELMVKFDPGPVSDLDSVQWAGVFKPIAEVDAAYAAAEPPAHDDWVPASMERSHSKTFVNVGLREIGRAVREFLRPSNVAEAQEGSSGAVVVADQLADLVGPALGSGPGQRRTRSPGRGSSSRPVVRVLEVVEAREEPSGESLRFLRVSVSSPSGRSLRVKAALETATETGNVSDIVGGHIVGWHKTQPDPADVRPGDTVATIDDGAEAWLATRLGDDYAVDVRFTAQEVE